MSATPETDALSPNVREPWRKYAERCKAFAAHMERQRDEARKDAERLAKGLAHMAAKNHHMAKPFDHLCICVACEAAQSALAAHEALTKTKN